MTGVQTCALPISLKELLDQISENRPLSSTVLAIKLNRHGNEDLRDLNLRSMPYQQVWFFWAASEDGVRWGIYGDALTDPGYFYYEYPGSPRHAA